MTGRGAEVVALSLGGALGTNARYWLATALKDRVDPGFPWATFVINVSGSFAIGVLTVALARWLPGHLVRLFLLVGFLGGYTTFSTFAFESHALWEARAIGRSLAYMAGSVAAGFLAVVLGIAIGRAVAGPEAPPATLAATDELKGVND